MPPVLRDGESDDAGETSAAVVDSASTVSYDVTAVNALLHKVLACQSDVPPALPAALARIGWAPAGFLAANAPPRLLLSQTLAELVPRAAGPLE